MEVAIIAIIVRSEVGGCYYSYYSEVPKIYMCTLVNIVITSVTNISAETATKVAESNQGESVVRRDI